MSENLLNLVNTIRDRKNKDEHKSYTSSLLSAGLSKCIAHNSKEIFFIDREHVAQKGSILINMDLMKIIDKIY